MVTGTAERHRNQSSTPSSRNNPREGTGYRLQRQRKCIEYEKHWHDCDALKVDNSAIAHAEEAHAGVRIEQLTSCTTGPAIFEHLN